MNTAKQSIDLLDVLTLDELKALTDEELRRFEALLSHWQQLAQGERQKLFRNPLNSTDGHEQTVPNFGGAKEGVNSDSLFSRRTIRDLAERLSEHIRDGSTVQFATAAANAQVADLLALLKEWDEPGACGCDTATCRETCLPARTRAAIAKATVATVIPLSK